MLDLLLIFRFSFSWVGMREGVRRKCFSEIMFSSFSRAVKVESIENATAIKFFSTCLTPSFLQCFLPTFSNKF